MIAGPEKRAALEGSREAARGEGRRAEDRRSKHVILTRCVASAVAVCLAATAAWGHTFPPMRTAVIQVESCELVVMIGYRPGTGESTESVMARLANSPKSRAVDNLRDVMTAYAVAPFTIAIDGTPLVPTKVRAKVGVEDGGARPMVVVLVTYALPRAGSLTVTTKDPRTTRISWQDRASGRIDLAQAPAQDHFYAGVASFLLKLSSTGDSACANTSSPSSR
jgi:hypothetical protein